jgi:hypothetical protein
MSAEQAPEESITTRWSRLYASLYYFLGKAMLDGFGKAGEKVLRRAIHDYGAYRASRVRADHEARGLAINLANMMNEGDMPNTDSLASKDRICTPSYFCTTVTECTLYDAWRDLGGVDVGRIYCQEVHEPLYCEYADGVTLDMPHFMTKGDQVCTFILTLPDAPDSPTQLASASREENAAPPETKIARLYGVLYYFLAKATLDAFGGKGTQGLPQGLRDYAVHEGDSLDEGQLARGWEIHHATHLAPTLAPARSTATGQAVYEAWREMEGDDIPIGRIYFQEIHRSG